jgi:hypothetical protein
MLRKLKQAEGGPQTPQGDLVKMAFKVLNNWDEAWDQWKAQLLMAALRPPRPTSRRAGQQCTTPGPAASATKWDTGQNTALHLACCQDPVHDVARMDTGRTIAPLCLCKVGQSPTPTLDRVKASQTTWAWWQKTDAALGPWPPSRSPQRSPG